MEMISLQGKTNFFEKHAATDKAGGFAFSTDEDF
jgi:hypothetical protein